MITYKIQVRDSSGNNLGEFQTFRNLKFSKKLNNYGICSFDVPVNDGKVSSLIALRVNTIHIYRNGVLFWAGEQAIREGNLDDKGNNWATITAYTWFEQLNCRYTVNEKIYTYQDGTQIAKDLIVQTQADTHGNFGITYGTLEVSTFREKTYTNASVMQSIIQLAGLDNGFDFEINDSKVFSVRNFIGIDRSSSVFLEYGTNISKCRLTEDFSNPATRGIVLGNTDSTGDAIRVEHNDSTLQTTYKLRESLYNESEVSGTTTLSDLAASLPLRYGQPIIKADTTLARGTTPTIEDFALGDLITLKIKKGIYDINEKFRVYEWQIAFGTDNTESLSLTISDFRLEA